MKQHYDTIIWVHTYTTFDIFILYLFVGEIIMMSVEYCLSLFLLGDPCIGTTVYECCKVAAYVHETVSNGRLCIGLLRTTCHGNIICYYRLPGVDYVHAKNEIGFTRFTCIGYRLISTFRINKRFRDIQQKQCNTVLTVRRYYLIFSKYHMFIQPLLFKKTL